MPIVDPVKYLIDVHRKIWRIRTFQFLRIILFPENSCQQRRGAIHLESQLLQAIFQKALIFGYRKIQVIQKEAWKNAKATC